MQKKIRFLSKIIGILFIAIYTLLHGYLLFLLPLYFDKVTSNPYGTFPVIYFLLPGVFLLFLSRILNQSNFNAGKTLLGFILLIVGIYLYQYIFNWSFLLNWNIKSYYFEQDCRKKSGMVVSSDNISMISHQAIKSCANLYSDADKPCQDSKDCDGACVSAYDYINYPTKPANGQTGQCQKYQNQTCGYIEITDSKLISHPCPIE